MQNSTLSPNSLGQKKALNILGLNPELFWEIGLRILTAYSQTTPNDASGAPGLYAYLAAVRAIRDILRPEGWEAFKHSNLEMATDGEHKVNILVSSGDKYTGKEQWEPSTKNPKGSQTKSIVYENSRHPYLFPEMNRPIPKQESTPTWFLLYHVDIKNAEMRMELSLPIGFDHTELKVHGWMSRIILDPIDFNSNQIEIEQDFGPEIEFEIKRKTNER